MAVTVAMPVRPLLVVVAPQPAKAELPVLVVTVVPAVPAVNPACSVVAVTVVLADKPR
jgi:hypothetical protein